MPCYGPLHLVALHHAAPAAWAARAGIAPDVEAVPSEAERAGGGASAGSCPSHRLTLSMMRMRSCAARRHLHVRPDPDLAGTEAGMLTGRNTPWYHSYRHCKRKLCRALAHHSPGRLGPKGCSATCT